MFIFKDEKTYTKNIKAELIKQRISNAVWMIITISLIILITIKEKQYTNTIQAIKMNTKNCTSMLTVIPW